MVFKLYHSIKVILRNFAMSESGGNETSIGNTVGTGPKYIAGIQLFGKWKRKQRQGISKYCIQKWYNRTAH